ncbi:oligopeptide ABC transporter periplasmic oligopeptide-binding protein [Actinobacillus equuli]|nr:oligopeptide ABC transporter periplasmic oligopeptide-binding protein [Actinobacillus equuli]
MIFYFKTLRIYILYIYSNKGNNYANKTDSLIINIAIVLGLSSTAFAAKVPEGTVLAEKQEIIINNGSEPASFDPQK